MTNQDRSVAYHAQQILLVFSLTVWILSFLFYPFAFCYVISTCILSIWQLKDFASLWLQNGWRKWYISLVLIGVLLVLLSYASGSLLFYFITPIYFLGLSFICWNLWHK